MRSTIASSSWTLGSSPRVTQRNSPPPSSHRSPLVNGLRGFKKGESIVPWVQRTGISLRTISRHPTLSPCPSRKGKLVHHVSAGDKSLNARGKVVPHQVRDSQKVQWGSSPEICTPLLRNPGLEPGSNSATKHAPCTSCISVSLNI